MWIVLERSKPFYKPIADLFTQQARSKRLVTWTFKDLKSDFPSCGSPRVLDERPDLWCRGGDGFVAWASVPQADSAPEGWFTWHSTCVYPPCRAAHLFAPDLSEAAAGSRVDKHWLTMVWRGLPVLQRCFLQEKKTLRQEEWTQNPFARHKRAGSVLRLRCGTCQHVS